MRTIQDDRNLLPDIDFYLSQVRTGDYYMHEGEKIGKPLNLSDAVNVFGKKIIPDALGIYHLFLNNQLVYIGMSKNLRDRLLQHLRNEEMNFDNCLWFCAHHWNENATIEDVLNIERNMIKKFKPLLNTQHVLSA